MTRRLAGVLVVFTLFATFMATGAGGAPPKAPAPAPRFEPATGSKTDPATGLPTRVLHKATDAVGLAADVARPR